MTHILNTDGPEIDAGLGGWKIVIADGGSFIGQVASETEESVVLAPAYTYIQNIGANQQGGIGVQRLILPLFMFAGCSEVQVERRAIKNRTKCWTLSSSDRAELVAAIKNAEKAKTSMRAQQNGIVTPQIVTARG